MRKTILVTGATDGIGLEAAKRLAAAGHQVVPHGRDAAKVQRVRDIVAATGGDDRVEGLVADLSRLADVDGLATSVVEQHTTIDVLINNAGVLRAPENTTGDGLDVRFAVNTIAPYVLTRRVIPLLGPSGRVINLSSAAQSPVDLAALAGHTKLSDNAAYAQSKLALTMWSRQLGLALADEGPAIVAVNPGSLLGTKMVKEGFGVAGADVGIGADILARAALSDEFASAAGQYFDNDAGRFAEPHRDALDPRKTAAVVNQLDEILAAR